MPTILIADDEKNIRATLSRALADVVGDELPCVVAVTDDGPVLLLRAEVLDRCRGHPHVIGLLDAWWDAKRAPQGSSSP